MVVYSDAVDDTVAPTHLVKKRVIDVVVKVTERYFLRQNCTDIVHVVLKTYARKKRIYEKLTFDKTSQQLITFKLGFR